MRNDVDVDANFLELCLHLRCDVLVEETLVDTHLDGQRLSVLLDDAVAVRVRISCRREHLLCLFGIVGACLERGIAVWSRCEEGAA